MSDSENSEIIKIPENERRNMEMGFSIIKLFLEFLGIAL